MAYKDNMAEFERHGITREYLQECFYYADGKLYWKERPRSHFKTEGSCNIFNIKHKGAEAGNVKKSDGYKIVSFRCNGKKHTLKVHRIIWLLETGEQPNVIDHINRIRTDNRLENLSNGTYFDNTQNTDYTKGTNFHKASGKWVAQINHNKKRIHIGLFDNPYDAIQAYRKKALELKGVDLNKENAIKDCINWFKEAVPNPTNDNLSVQSGCIVEEFSELLTALGLRLESVEKISTHLKNKSISIDLSNKNEILDALVDIIVTNIGLANMLGMDINGALAEVVRSNWSKFENGKPVFDDNGKIKKGENYTPPQLQEFI